jgi:hypothetical protein
MSYFLNFLTALFAFILYFAPHLFIYAVLRGFRTFVENLVLLFIIIIIIIIIVIMYI